jgi:hypothetical protein
MFFLLEWLAHKARASLYTVCTAESKYHHWKGRLDMMQFFQVVPQALKLWSAVLWTERSLREKQKGLL